MNSLQENILKSLNEDGFTTEQFEEYLKSIPGFSFLKDVPSQSGTAKEFNAEDLLIAINKTFEL